MRVGMGHEGARTEIHISFWQENFKERDMIYILLTAIGLTPGGSSRNCLQDLGVDDKSLLKFTMTK
jgi:hypothetical protein